MLQHVNTVLIAKTAPASFSNVDSLADGAIALFDENKKLLTTAANAAAANAIYVGVCQGTEDVYNEEGTKTTKAVIKYSMPIQKVYVTIPDESSVEHAKQLIQKVMNGETITDDDLK